MLGLLVYCYALLACAQSTEAPLRLAVHPYASTLSLISTHRPLVQYLSLKLGRPVEFYTAPSFEAYVDTLLAGGYDIAISPPHFALLAMEKHYLPVLHYQARLEPLLVVRNDSPWQKIEDFRGRRIAMADKTALIRLATVKLLADKGMRAGQDYRIVERPSHGATIGAALAGEAEAGLATISALRQMPANVQQLVRGIPTGQSFPHLFTLVNRQLGEDMPERLRKILLSFQDQPEGSLFMTQVGLIGYQSISEGEIRAIRPYAEMYRQLMAGEAR